MALPESFKGRLRLPAVVAPMFLISGPDLVVECCKAGLVGTFPALNCRSSEAFEQWLIEIQERLQAHEREAGKTPAPFGVNLIVHKTNARWEADLELCVRYRVPLVITSLGAVSDLVDRVHGYGGLVFHDVTNMRHARKTVAAGVDGLIAVCNGAGGHAGTLNPFALLSEIRGFFDGTLLLSGCINDGRQIAAARLLGADLAYMGTRFINTAESQADGDLQQMIVDAEAADILYTTEVSGVPGNFIRQSIVRAGLDPDNLAGRNQLDFGTEKKKAWKHIWSAGQGVGGIGDVPGVASLAARLIGEYRDGCGALAADGFAVAGVLSEVVHG
ncbi:2-nitropropane dioxygenase [Marinobacterium nitratireducens]|uniref:2-nitropropane dioxygenase n=1 Tax=Marinobacterium nitratireducens TaxID=518897 RepID=A0A917ZF82_9GAMM|nr:nitronate monooxygenase [Marinobacterium nitratireducens]GGO81895.1 2-nitropropane dioxygenase [Marinobacterium nitratireducens]